METIPCDYVFSSMPVKDLIGAVSEAAPAAVRDVAEGLCYRDFRTAGILLKKMRLGYALNENVMNGMPKDTWIYVQEKGVRLGRVQLFNNWSPYLVQDFKNTVWIGLEYFCQEGDDLWTMSDSEFTRFATAEAVQIGLIDEADVLDAVSYRVPKAYPAYFGTYPRFDVVRDYLDSFDNLFVMGRNGMHRYNNMDHSVLSAMAAVECVCSPTADKKAVWTVNAEKEYHETKNK